jgi:hypothetical protein
MARGVCRLHRNFVISTVEFNNSPLNAIMQPGHTKAYMPKPVMAKGHTHYCGLVPGLHVKKITICGTPNCLYYCVILQYIHTNVAAGRIIQPGGPWIGDPCTKGCTSYMFSHFK